MADDILPEKDPETAKPNPTRALILKEIRTASVLGRTNHLKGGLFRRAAGGLSIPKPAMPHKKPSALIIPVAVREAVKPDLPVTNDNQQIPPVYRFPFEMTELQLLEYVRWATRREEYDLARIIQNYIDYGEGGCEKDKYAEELGWLAQDDRFNGPLKAVLNAGGDACGWDGAISLDAFYYRCLANMRTFLCAGADASVITAEEIEEARAEGHENLARAVEDAQAGRPIVRHYFCPELKK